MKRIIGIWKNDIKAVFRNYAVLIVVVALCIIPSIYAWVSIKEARDSYSEEATLDIKIGVVNLDQGVAFDDRMIRIGDTLIEELSRNNQFDWQFVDQEKAREEINLGNYYAVITITEDFSKNLISVTGTDVTRGKIIYTVNEKMNGIASKWTEKGVSNLAQFIRNTVTDTVRGTVSSVLSKEAQEVGVNLKEQIPNLTTAYEKLQEIIANYDEMNQTVEDTDAGVVLLKNLLNHVFDQLIQVESILAQANLFHEQLKEYFIVAQEKAEQLIPQIKTDLGLIAGISNEINLQVKSITTWIESKSDEATGLFDQLEAKIRTIQRMTDSMNKVLSAMNQLSIKKPLDDFISQLTKVKDALNRPLEVIASLQDQLDQGKALDLDILPEMNKVCQSVQDTLDNAVDNFDKNIADKITDLFDSEKIVTDDMKESLAYVTDSLPKVKELLALAQTSVMKGKVEVDTVWECITEAEQKIQEFTIKLGEVNEDSELQRLAELLKTDETSRADFLADPVEIVGESSYPMQDDQTGRTPFYTVLSLWISILLVVSMLSVKAQGDYSITQEYFGKLSFFITISMVQAIIVTLGDLWILQIYCSNPFLFIGSNLLTSVVFTTIVYTLVSLFGNGGKVITIILLILQLHSISPWLPSMYAISLNREAIGGVVNAVLIKDAILLCSYMVVALILGVVLKRPINRMLSGFVRRFHDSHLSKGA